jgi:hypothetical protein
MRNRAVLFSVDRLMEFLTALGRDAEITARTHASLRFLTRLARRGPIPWGKIHLRNALTGNTSSCAEPTHASP